MFYDTLRRLRPVKSRVDLVSSDRNLRLQGNSKSKTRGLPLFYDVISGQRVSELAASYVYHFIDYAFEAFELLDSYDVNWFLHYWGFQKPGVPHNRRWPASEAFREFDFGYRRFRRPPVKDGWYASPRRIVNRTPWRLIGYCFWDKKRVALMRLHLRSGIQSLRP